MENELGALKSTVSLYEDEAKRFKVKLSTTRQ
jgi:CRISPR/Cas system CMR subunit Cmr4 (Cas7 group RAMP superfamily)